MEFHKDTTKNTKKTNQIQSVAMEDKSFNLVRNEAIVCNLLLWCRKSGYLFQETVKLVSETRSIETSYSSTGLSLIAIL